MTLLRNSVPRLDGTTQDTNQDTKLVWWRGFLAGAVAMRLLAIYVPSMPMWVSWLFPPAHAQTSLEPACIAAHTCLRAMEGVWIPPNSSGVSMPDGTNCTQWFSANGQMWVEEAKQSPRDVPDGDLPFFERSASSSWREPGELGIWGCTGPNGTGDCVKLPGAKP